MEAQLRVEELLKKIQELEAGQAHLKQEISQLIENQQWRGGGDNRRSQSVSPERTAPRRRGGFDDGVGVPVLWNKKGFASFRSREAFNAAANGGGPAGVEFSERQYLNILQSMGQSVHIFDLTGRIIYWNRTAEHLYGYSAAEALGRDAIELLIDAQDYAIANEMVHKVTMGESWTGQFPVKNKRYDTFIVITTSTPFYDDDGTLVGIICVSSDSRPFQETRPAFLGTNHSEPGLSGSCPKTTASAKLGLVPQQPIPVAIASKLSNLASKVSNKVKSKIKTGDNNMVHEGGSGDCHYPDNGLSDTVLFDHKEEANSSGDMPKAPFRVRDSGDDSEGKLGIHKIITSKAEEWIGKKGIAWPWKGIEREGSEGKIVHVLWPWSHSDQESDSGHEKSSDSGAKQESQVGGESNRHANNEAPGSWSSFNVNSTGSASSCGSTSSGTINKVDSDMDCLDYEILWEDLTIGEQIGQGSCGTVYHALWYGSDVAVKVFSKQEYSDDTVLAFRQEVSLMKRLRHPNILLFMGAVTSPQCLCIVTEFLPRGSLFRLLKRSMCRLDWKRRVHMALDIARGMNYLHHCNPPIIHRDLKSSNLLVDKSWTVKVGDFGLSRLKHETYLTTKTGKGTPQWMAPEVLRNEPSNEKSDIYAYGVILWELVSEKIPWDNLNSMQVIGAVGFMNQHLEIPKDVDPQWASIIESCWHSEPHCRPTFQELLAKLKDLQKQYSTRSQVARSATEDISQREL